ncbi:hypothetical protein MBLNU230_g8318t1 [Neophaeotheca triangularis]
MSDDEERVTMPFKFVTGPQANRTLQPPEWRGEQQEEEEEEKQPKTDSQAPPPRPTGFDARFPNQNQTKHCWQNYVDYHKCILAKGEDFKPCRQFYLAYRSLCPSSWCERWDDQRENGTFPARLDQ